MTLTQLIAANVAFDVALVGAVIYAMSHPTRLTRYTKPTWPVAAE